MLTEVEIRAAKAVEKPLKLFDGGGLYLLVTPNGGRWRRLKYRYEGKERGISLGVYPDVSLKRARICRDDARRMIAEGVDPSARRQADKNARAVTFQVIADEWLDIQAKKLAPVTLSKARWMITEFVVPHIGSRRWANLSVRGRDQSSRARYHSRSTRRAHTHQNQESRRCHRSRSHRSATESY